MSEKLKTVQSRVGSNHAQVDLHCASIGYPDFRLAESAAPARFNSTHEQPYINDSAFADYVSKAEFLAATTNNEYVDSAQLK